MQLTQNKIIKNKYFAEFDKVRWMYFGSMFIYLISFCFIIAEFVDALQHNTPTDNGWTVVDKYTNQSNVLLLVFAVLYTLFPKHAFFKNHKFLIATMTYIFFTFFGYNIILSITKGTYSSPEAWKNAASVFTHLLSPLLFISVGIATMMLNPNKQLASFKSTLIPLMIYPTIYLIYTATIPYVLKTYTGEHYSIYGNATNTAEYPAFAWPMIFVVYIFFFPGSAAMFYFLFKYNNKVAAFFKKTFKSTKTKSN